MLILQIPGRVLAMDAQTITLQHTATVSDAAPLTMQWRPWTGQTPPPIGALVTVTATLDSPTSPPETWRVKSWTRARLDHQPADLVQELKAAPTTTGRRRA